MKLKIGPSILNADLSRIYEESAKLLDSGADFLHLDVMDGHFVPNITFGHPVVKCLRRHISSATFEAHMMVSEPLKWTRPFADAGVNVYTFHDEAVDDVEDAIRRVAEVGFAVGVALNPGTERDDEYFDRIIPQVDRILIMTVNPGFGGQRFLAECLTKVAQIRRLNKHVNIEVDGGVSDETAALCASSGANYIVSGSAISSSSDYAAAISKIRKTIHEHYTY